MSNQNLKTNYESGYTNIIMQNYILTSNSQGDGPADLNEILIAWFNCTILFVQFIPNSYSVLKANLLHLYYFIIILFLGSLAPVTGYKWPQELIIPAGHLLSVNFSAALPLYSPAKK